MATIPVLAACGLLYSAVVVDPSVSSTVRSQANAAVQRISMEAAAHGQSREVSAKAWHLAAHLKQHPEELDQLADAIGPECQQFLHKE
jgi:hypothetical protein